MHRIRQLSRAFAGSIVVGLAVLATTARATAAQTATISGRVTSTANLPLAGARVVVVGTTITVVSGPDGTYSLRDIPPGAVEVRALRVAFKEQKRSVTVAPGQTATVDFALEASAVSLQEVVITATGEQRKVEIGNSVAVVDAAVRVQETPIHNMGDLLVAKAPGLSVLPGNMSGTGAQIRIRGLNSISRSNAPIFIIDGVRMDGGAGGIGVGGSNSSRLNDLTPEEIDRLEIVKGPSAATLYGTDAANGVIIITTKKGRAGSTRYTFTAEQGKITDPNKYWDTYAIWGHTPANPTVQTRCILPNIATGACIQDSVTTANILRNPDITPIGTGDRNLYGMQMSGGSEAVRFFLSGNREEETGPIRMPGVDRAYLATQQLGVRDEWQNPEALQRLSVRANVDAALSRKLDVGVSTSFIKSDQRLPQVDNNVNSFYYNAYTNPGFVQPYTCTAPCSGLAYSGIGNLGQPLLGWGQFTPAHIFQSTVLEGVQRMIGSVNANWRPFSWLQNNATTGIDLISYDNFRLCRLNECPNFGTQRQGTIGDVHGTDRIFTAKLTSAATWTPRQWLNVTGTLGADYNNNESQFSSASSTQLPPGGQTVGSGAVKNASNLSPTATKTLGTFAQGQFAIHDRLFITTALRADQNTAFGTDYKGVTYPSAQVAWVVSQERFFPQLDFLNELRLRSAYGSAGVQPGATSALRTFSATTVSLTTDQTALLAAAIGNPNLKPETTTELELGFDSKWLGDRASFEFTWYRKQSKDALINQNIATSAGAPVGSVLRNLGAVRNTGMEASLNAQILDVRNFGEFGWDVTVGGSTNANKIITLGVDDAGKKIPTIGTVTRQQEGYPLNSFFLQAYTYADADNNGLISVSEVTLGDTGVFVGASLPTKLVTVQNGFDFLRKKLRITAALDYRGGFKLFNSGNNFLCGNTNACAAKSNPQAPLWEQARQVAANLTNPKTTFGYYEDGDAWRLREVSAVLRLPDRWASRMRAMSADMQFGARNLKTWTDYTGQDPEANYSTGDVQQDFLTTAPRKYFTARLNLRY
ncbi:MAG: SusC/RagA family TonB-linked outer membrane protein [Gemmatimonadaceae bacterium]